MDRASRALWEASVRAWRAPAPRARENSPSYRTRRRVPDRADRERLRRALALSRLFRLRRGHAGRQRRRGAGAVRSLRARRIRVRTVVALERAHRSGAPLVRHRRLEPGLRRSRRADVARGTTVNVFFTGVWPPDFPEAKNNCPNSGIRSRIACSLPNAVGAARSTRCVIRDEDQARFRTVVLPHLDDCYRLARWLTGNRADAEDVVQEACLDAFRGITGFGGSHPRAWVLTIVRHAAYRWLRKNRPAALVVVDDLEALSIPGAQIADSAA